MSINEKIKQADSILISCFDGDKTSVSELNKLLKEIVNDLMPADKEILNYKMKSVNLDDENLTIKDMRECLELIKWLENIHKREEDNSVYTKKAISSNKYTPDNPYPHG